MTTYISILRGINVSGHNQIKMDALRQMYTELGYSNVQSYIQSGNVLFRHNSLDTHELEKNISNKIVDTFGLIVPVLVISSGDLESVLENNPFLNDHSKDRGYMHLTFLSEIPDKMLLDKIQTAVFSPDELSCSGKVIYLYCPAGYGRTKLTNTFFERKLNLTATTRNLKTATELITLAQKL